MFQRSPFCLSVPANFNINIVTLLTGSVICVLVRIIPSSNLMKTVNVKGSRDHGLICSNFMKIID